VTEKVPTESAEAAIWLARIERGLQTHEGTQLREWLQQTEHRDAIVNTAKLYHGPDVVAVLAELVPVGFGNPPPPMPRQPRTFAIVVGVCLALLMGIVPFMAMRHAFPRLFDAHYKPTSGALPRDEEIYSTGARETRSIKLPDSSAAILNGQSQLYVLYAAWVREATVAHGEVIFDVTLKWPKPMLIFAGGRHFEAPAGRFDLRVTGPQTVELTVLEGSVTVKGLPFQRPTTPAEARDFDPSVFADAAVGPMQTALLDHGVLTRHAITQADLRSQLRWEPEQVVYVSP
jgi:ferric-dicitrate binding protein FerR (iron transport regulator)